MFTMFEASKINPEIVDLPRHLIAKALKGEGLPVDEGYVELCIYCLLLQKDRNWKRWLAFYSYK